MYGHQKIRVLSLGTGEPSFSPIDAKTFSHFEETKNIGEFMMNIDTYNSHYITKAEITFATKAEDYLRVQTNSDLSMDKVGREDIINLKSNGEVMWQQN